MTNRQLAEFILTLPEDIQQGDTTSVVEGFIFTAKRAVAFRFKDGTGRGIYIEPMGAHLRDTTGAAMDFVGHISHGGSVVSGSTAAEVGTKPPFQVGWWVRDVAPHRPAFGVVRGCSRAPDADEDWCVDLYIYNYGGVRVGRISPGPGPTDFEPMIPARHLRRIIEPVFPIRLDASGNWVHSLISWDDQET